MSTGALEASVTLEDVFSVVQGKRVPLAAELAGYLALEIADGANAAAGEIEARNVFIGEEGTVALVQPKREAQASETEASIRNILAKLLEASGSQTPALGAAARRKAGPGLPSLVEELEAALIPVNRAAGRRALARLAREVKRVTMGIGRNAAPTSERRPESEAPPRPRASSQFEDDVTTMKRPGVPAEALRAAATEPRSAEAAPAPAAPKNDAPPPRKSEHIFAGDEVDSLLATFEVSSNMEDKAVSRELKAIAGLEPTPPPPTAKAQDEATGPATDDSVEALLAMTDPKSAAVALGKKPASIPPAKSADAPAQRPQQKTEPLIDAPPPSTRGQAPVAAPAVPLAAPVPLTQAALPPAEFQKPRAPRSSLVMLVAVLIAAGAGTVALYKFYPTFFSGRKVSPPPSASAVPVAASAGQDPALARCKVSLAVTGVPAEAEFLLRVGQAPLDVERMPKGPRLEFVATAEGYAPKRTVIPKGASWDTLPDGKPRYELAVQLDPSKAKPGTIDPWPVGEPGSEVGGSGQPGTVHLVATPKGAEIWLLAGVGPQAQIDQLRCDGDIEVLVASKNRPRLKITKKDIEAVPADPTGLKAIKLNVAGKLEQ